MGNGSKLIERYLIAAMLPYLCLALLLLTAMLLLQQASKFAEVLGAMGAPLQLAVTVTLGLAPGVMLFTIPMAVLAGAVIGCGRMGSDSELVAMRAAGIGTMQLIQPFVVIGGVATALTMYVGMEAAPQAAQMLRETAQQAALHKLASPVEPRAFNTEIPGKVIYVRDGDKDHGQWSGVFIYAPEGDGRTRLITARYGRIDVSADQSELVLSDAILTTLPAQQNGAASSGEITVDRSAQWRVKLDTGRRQLIEGVSTREVETDEMNWRDLIAQSRDQATTEAKRRNSVGALHKRLALCMAPLFFALLGASVGVRLRRGGRGAGAFIALAVMACYYLVSLAGERITHTVGENMLPAWAGAWLATGLAVLFSSALLALGDQGILGKLKIHFRRQKTEFPSGNNGSGGGRAGHRQTGFSGLLDRNILRSLYASFAVTFTTLVVVFLVFTVFELWRFVQSNGAGWWLVVRYLFFLLPLAGVSLAPFGVLVAVLVVYSIMARRSEVIAWWASGQSVYRLALPGLLFAASIGGGMWLVQEHLLPQANQRQDALRAQIRRSPLARAVTPIGRQWVASTRRVYSYEYVGIDTSLKLPVVYEFDGEGIHLHQIVKGSRGILRQMEEGAQEKRPPPRLLIEDAEILKILPDGAEIDGSQRVLLKQQANELIEDENVSPEMFKPMLNKPSQLNTAQLSEYIKRLKERGDFPSLSALRAALERRRADPFVSIVMFLIAIPLAIAYGRRSAVSTLFIAVVVGVVFWGTLNGFQQVTVYGLLPPVIAVWTPLAIFAALGFYLLSRTRT